MTRTETVARAMAIIGNGARHDEVWRTVRFAPNFAAVKRAMQSGRYGTVTKKQKTAAARIARTLRVLQAQLNCSDLSASRSDFPLDDDDLEFLRRKYQAAAATELLPSQLRAVDHAKRKAAEHAKRLLEKHGLPVTILRNGKFVRLASLLYGDESANLFHICRQVKARSNQS